MSFEPSKIREQFHPMRDHHWPRFLFNLNPRNLWDNPINPWNLTKKRTAREDLSHSYVNLFVEGWRAAAYGAGHVLAVLVPFGALALIAGIVSS